jgi:outer membrane murein-binding lipoprotein Lpp
MSTPVVDVVDDWNERPFTGGYRTLNELADGEFSGVCRAGGAELYMTSGTVVGVLQGSIEDFEGAEGTTYEAPSPALPLLAVMQERSDEVRAQYYTEETPVTDVDRTLSDGGFSGYLELSENVLSGDYYLVYYGGRSMSVAFVGASGRLITDDEAFETVENEVGIYEVRPVAIEPTDVPEPESEPATEAVAGATAETVDETDTETSPDPSPDLETETDETPETDKSSTTSDTATEQAGSDAVEAEAGSAGSEPEPESGAESGPEPQQEPASPDTGADGSTTGLRLEKQAIPSLDPDRTAPATAGSTRGDAGRRASTTPSSGVTDGEAESQAGQTQSPNSTERDQQTATDASETEATTDRSDESDTAAAGHVSDERVDELESELAERESTIERLEAELADATEEKEALEAELDSLREERDDLSAEVERLESQVDQLEAEFGAARAADQRLTPAEALDGTDIFVRYGSKGKATLEKANDGGPGREEVNGNLRLEKHTQFDAAAAAVGGQSYEAFFEETMAFQFVRWVMRDLLFEIHETGHTAGLTDLFDAIPDVDRAELSGTVDTTDTETGEETHGGESFDVVLRDRMGDPLLVANLNDSREAATQSMMERLVTAAERVGQSNSSLAGAFLVTRSFFEPGALETASEATRSGLLSRSKRESFVNLSRKRGYHLCLVEARKQQFNLAVPDL